MLMPEAAVYEDDFASWPENDIWATGQAADVQTISEAHFGNELAHEQFGCGIP